MILGKYQEFRSITSIPRILDIDSLYILINDLFMEADLFSVHKFK